MKLFICIYLLFIVKSNAQSQSKTESEWRDKYTNEQNWTGTNYCTLIDIIKWQPLKDLKKYQIKDIKGMLLGMPLQDLDQMNTDGLYYCCTKHEDMFNLWNLYYPKLTQTTWDTYCKGLIVLMYLDGYFTTQ